MAESQLGRWAMLALFLVAGTVLYTDLARLKNPVGEKYLPSFPPGQVDFGYVYQSARALVAGVDPYHHHHRPEFGHQFGVERIDGRDYTQLYPPAHVLLYVP